MSLAALSLGLDKIAGSGGISVKAVRHINAFKLIYLNM